MEREEAPSLVDQPDFFELLPDVPFLHVLNCLSGAEIEGARIYSRSFMDRIDRNRNSLRLVDVSSLEVDQNINHEVVDEVNIMESRVRLTIKVRKNEPPRFPTRVRATTLRETLSFCKENLSKMEIDRIGLTRLDESTFEHLRARFSESATKCTSLFIQTRITKDLGLDDIRAMVLQLEPKNLSLKINGVNILTREFLQEPCICGRQQLAIEAFPESGYDDELLCGLTVPVAIIGGLSVCTFEGIANFLKQWKAGERTISKIRFRTSTNGQDINEWISLLPWNIPALQSDQGVYPFLLDTEVENVEKKKIRLKINQNTLNECFTFEMIDVDLPEGYPSWLPNNEVDGPWDDEDYSDGSDDYGNYEYEDYEQDYDQTGSDYDYDEDFNDVDDMQFQGFHPVDFEPAEDVEAQMRHFMDAEDLNQFFVAAELNDLMLQNNQGDEDLDHADPDEIFDDNYHDWDE